MHVLCGLAAFRVCCGCDLISHLKNPDFIGGAFHLPRTTSASVKKCSGFFSRTRSTARLRSAATSLKSSPPTAITLTRQWPIFEFGLQHDGSLLLCRS